MSKAKQFFSGMTEKLKSQPKKVLTAIRELPKNFRQNFKQLCVGQKRRWKKFVRKIATFNLKEWFENVKKNPRDTIYNFIRVALVLVILISGGKLLFNVLADVRSNKQFEDIQDMVNALPPSGDVDSMVSGSLSGEQDGETVLVPGGAVIENDEGIPQYYEIEVDGKNIRVPLKNLDWDAMKKINKHIYAWISIPGTMIDYPVLQHPTENDYYLHMTLDHKYSLDGNIYSQVQYNKKDFSDFHTVLYGHNRRSNGKMFRTLHNFENEHVFKSYQYVFIYTEQGVYIYRIFAAYETTSEHQIATYRTDNYNKVISYVEKVMKKAEKSGYVRDIMNEEHLGKVLTLSTCVGDDQSVRYLVQTMLIYDPTMQEQTE